MKKIIITVLTLFILSAFTVPKNKPEVVCLHQSTKFMVDGKTTDWKSDSLKFDNKTGFAYAFSNNNRMLFVQLKMLNVNVQRKALITGLTLWIDPRGKGKHVLGIEYPQGRIHQQNARTFERKPSGQQHRRTNHKMNQLQLHLFNERYQSEKPTLKGFVKAGIAHASVGDGGIKVLLQMDTLGHVVYEAQIPLKMIFAQPDEYLSKHKPFSVIFETGYFHMNMSQMHGGGGMGGGRGQRMGNGQRPNPSRMAFMQNMTEPSRLKIKTIYLFQEK